MRSNPGRARAGAALVALLPRLLCLHRRRHLENRGAVSRSTKVGLARPSRRHVRRRQILGSTLERARAYPRCPPGRAAHRCGSLRSGLNRQHLPRWRRQESDPAGGPTAVHHRERGRLPHLSGLGRRRRVLLGLQRQRPARQRGHGPPIEPRARTRGGRGELRRGERGLFPRLRGHGRGRRLLLGQRLRGPARQRDQVGPVEPHACRRRRALCRRERRHAPHLRGHGRGRRVLLGRE